MSEKPESYDCNQCILSGKQNKMRGRDCLLERDWLANPAPYSAKLKNLPEVRGVIKSDEEFLMVVDQILELYQVDDIKVALRRIGKGICPKSFPISRESLYFLDLYARTHGGEHGGELQHLPVDGGVLDQPQYFFAASDIIGRVRSRYFAEKYKAQNNDAGEHRRPEGAEGKAYTQRPSKK